MNEFLRTSSFFCIALTVAAFCLGSFCQKKWKLAILNPVLLAGGMVILALTVLKVPAEDFQRNCAPLQYLMTPATICLAISFADQFDRLRKHLPAALAGVVAGTVASLGSIYCMAKAFGLTEALTVSLLPKSVTSAIGVALSEQAGGIGAVTTVVIVITGVLGNMAGPALAKLFRLKDPVSTGVAIGTCSHVIGTTKAVEMSELTGAVSSLSLTLSGILTSILFPILTGL